MELAYVVQDKQAREFWEGVLKVGMEVEGERERRMQWAMWSRAFLPHLLNYHYLPLPSTHPLLLALPHLFRVHNDMVSLASFLDMVEWFGPFHHSSFLRRIKQISSLPYFFGHLSAEAAEALLHKCKPGTFLLRFSSHPATFAISVTLGGSNVRHHRIVRDKLGTFSFAEIENLTDRKVFENIERLLKASKEELHLKAYCQGSIYHKLYSSKNPEPLKELCCNFIVSHLNEFKQRHSAGLQKYGRILTERQKQKSWGDWIFILKQLRMPLLNELLCHDELATVMWQIELQKDVVPTMEFLNAFEKMIGIPAVKTDDLDPMTFIQVACFKALLKELGGGTEVSLELFSKILHWFGPLDKEILERIYRLVRHGYFHGNISAEVATKRLEEKRQAGTYLVRLSTTIPGVLMLAVMDSDKYVHHYRIDYHIGNGYSLGTDSAPSIHELIIALSAELELSQPCSGSAYQSFVNWMPASSRRQTLLTVDQAEAVFSRLWREQQSEGSL